MARKPMARPKARRPERKAPKAVNKPKRSRASAEANRRQSRVYHRPGLGQFLARHLRLFVGSIGRLLRHGQCDQGTLADTVMSGDEPERLVLPAAGGGNRHPVTGKAGEIPDFRRIIDNQLVGIVIQRRHSADIFAHRGVGLDGREISAAIEFHRPRRAGRRQGGAGLHHARRSGDAHAHSRLRRAGR